MKIKKILYTPTFRKGWEKIPQKVQKKAIKQEQLFRQDVFHKSLSTHKLKGKLANYWSYSIDHRTRIVFRFLKEDEVLFVDIRTYEIYK